MQIEDVTATALRDTTDEEVRNMRHRFIQLYAGNFANPFLERIGGLTKKEFLERYILLRQEMTRRGMELQTEAEIDRRVRDRMVKRSMWGLDVPALGDVVLVESYIAIGGSFVKDPKGAEDLDIIIRQDEGQRDEGMELKVGRLLEKETSKEAHFVYAPRGPHSSYLPVFDLVLRARPDTRSQKVEESEKVEKKLTEAQQKDYDTETARIRENRRKWGTIVHKFKPALWTHPNGHPRCILCGSEESIGGICNKEPTKRDVEANRKSLEAIGLNVDEIKEELAKAMTPEQFWETLEKEQDAVADKRVDIEKLTPGRTFTPLKTTGGYGSYEFADVVPLWTTWASGYVPSPGIAVETKFDGFRVTLHKQGQKVEIFSEDAKRDLSDRLADVTKELQSYPDASLILDGELLCYTPDGKKVERMNMPSYLMAKEPPTFKATIECFDCLYRDGKSLEKEPWTARQTELAAVFGKVDEKLVHKVVPTVVHTEAAFRAAVAKHAAVANSEGAMCKVTNSAYPTSGKTSEWAKFKNFKELRVKVVAAEDKGDNGFIYDCEIGGGIPIGRTYATKVKATKGDVLEVMVAEVKYGISAEGEFSWDNPIVRSFKPAGTALTTKDQAIALSHLKRTVKAEKAATEVGFKEGDSGTGIAQIHVMGLTEEQTTKLKDAGSQVMVAVGDAGKLKSALMSAVGNAGAHCDMRMRRGSENYWEGNEVFVGNVDGIDKLAKLQKEGESLRSEWKAPHKDEPGGGENVVQGPLGWMEAGARKPEIFAPGEPGATTNKYGAMVRIDKYTWKLYSTSGGTAAAPHAFKFHFEGGHYFNGNFLWGWVPVAEGQRIWMVRRLADDDDKKQEPAEKSYMFKFLKVDKKQQIVGGLVYEPDVQDTQGDYTDTPEIQKAMYKFMLRYAIDSKRIKVMHKGQPHYFPIVECFQPEQNTRKGNQEIKAGSWWLMVKVTNPDVWSEIEKGRLTGFSMGGRASA